MGESKTESSSDSKSEEPEGTWKQFLGCLGIFIGIPALLVGMVLLLMRMTGGGEELARMPLGTSSSEATFALQAETVVQVWADLDVRHEGISSMKASEDLPHVLDYVIELESEGHAPLALRCNPFDSHIYRTSGRHNSMGDVAGRYYDGALDGCALRLPAGSYRLRAHRETVAGGDARFHFGRTDLILRAP